MGNLLSQLLNRFSGAWRNKPQKILILGLDGAGKTTLLFRLQLDEVVVTVPTIGFNVETVEYNNIKFQVWDLGGQESIRPFWRCYYLATSCLIFVIDCTDRARVPLAKAELGFLCDDEDLSGVPLLIFANKQDVEDAMKPTELSDALSLTSIRDRPWTIVSCSGLKGIGITDGLDWVCKELSRR